MSNFKGDLVRKRENFHLMGQGLGTSPAPQRRNSPLPAPRRAFRGTSDPLRTTQPEGDTNKRRPSRFGGLCGAAPAARRGLPQPQEGTTKPSPKSNGAGRFKPPESQISAQISVAASVQRERLSSEGRRRFKSHGEHLRGPAIAFPKSR